MSFWELSIFVFIQILLEKRAKAGLLPELTTSSKPAKSDDDDIKSTCKHVTSDAMKSTSMLTSSDESSTSSNSSQVKVNVYNINTKEKRRNSPGSESPHYGTLRLKERMPEKWQMSPASGGSPAEPVVSSGTPIPRSGLAATMSAKQAATPGTTAAAEENLKKMCLASAHAVSAASPALKRLGTPSGHQCNVPSPLATSNTYKSPSSSQHPSLRSNLKRGPNSTSVLSNASPSLSSNENSARLSLCSHPLTPTASTTSDNNLLAVTPVRSSHRAHSATVATKVTSILTAKTNSSGCHSSTSGTSNPSNVSSRSLKRDREEDATSCDVAPPNKKTCHECGSIVSVAPAKSSSSNNDTSMDLDCNVPSETTCALCVCTNKNNSSHLTHSPKSPKIKSSIDSKSSGKKSDDIQSPVISSSCSSSNNLQNLSTSLSVRRKTSNSSVSIMKNVKRTLKLSVESSGKGSCLGPRVLVKKVGRTRSAAQLSHKSPLKLQPENKNPIDFVTVSPTASINNNVWTNSKAENCHQRASNTISSIRSRCKHNSVPNLRNVKLDDSSSSRHSTESTVTRAVLKSVNRGSPFNSNKKCHPLKSHHLNSRTCSELQALVKTSKYAKSTSKKRSMSVPSVVSSDAVTAPPPKKKSAKMYLRSGKPMITRSQEKTCKFAKPK